MIRAHLVVQKCTALQNPINKDKWAMETSMERTQEYVTAHIIHPQTAELETQSLCVHTQSQSRILLSAYVCANTHKHTHTHTHTHTLTHTHTNTHTHTHTHIHIHTHTLRLSALHWTHAYDEQHIISLLVSLSLSFTLILPFFIPLSFFRLRSP